MWYSGTVVVMVVMVVVMVGIMGIMGMVVGDKVSGASNYITSCGVV